VSIISAPSPRVEEGSSVVAPPYGLFGWTTVVLGVDGDPRAMLDRYWRQFNANRGYGTVSKVQTLHPEPGTAVRHFYAERLGDVGYDTGAQLHRQRRARRVGSDMDERERPRAGNALVVVTPCG
jgi:hypothetical protein